MTTDSNKLCPKCGTVIPPEAAQGLCPKCVLANAAVPNEVETGLGRAPEIPSLAAVAKAFPQLEIIELVGAGGMAAVFKARQPHLDRHVALKLLSTRLARNPQFAERFHREGRVLARLSHPNIVSVYDFGQQEGFYYLLMEFVDGVNLRQAMRAGRFSPAEALGLVPRICEALQYAHEEGILHRDIKPENILLDAKGRVKIADFGIAKLIGEIQAEVTLTATGAALGTPHYMAPEQLERPAEVDHRADIYSLGVVFYEMLTGELPLGRFAPPSEKTPLDERIDAIVFRALAKERERRQQTAGQMKVEVETLTSPAAAAAAEPAGPPLAAESRPPKVLCPNVPAAIGALVLPIVSLGLFGFVAARLFPDLSWRFAEFAKGSALGFPVVASLLLGLTLPIAAAVWKLLDWGERRRNGTVLVGGFPPMPAWAKRCAWLALFAAMLSLFKTAWVLCHGRPNEVVWIWDWSLLLSLGSYAIWRRNATARLAATLGAAGIFLMTVFSLWLVWTMPTPWRALPQPSSTFSSGLVSMIAWPATLWMLWQRDVRRSFGMGLSSDTMPGPRHLSKTALAGALLVMLGLPLPLLLGSAVLFRLGGVGPGETAIVLAFGWLPALAGTVLGWLALDQIRSSQGRLVGTTAALGAALALPLLIVLGTMTIPLATVITRISHAQRLHPILAMVAALTSASSLVLAIWGIQATRHWVKNNPAERHPRWASGLLMTFGLTALIFFSTTRLPPRSWGQLPENEAASLLEPAIAEVHLTFTVVEVREVNNRQQLLLDYQEERYGNVELLFGNEGVELTTLSPAAADTAHDGGPERVGRHIEWLLPSEMSQQQVEALRDWMLAERLGKSLIVGVDQEEAVFAVQLPAGGWAKATVTAKLSDPIR
ncbi:MAG: serine/threonine-protein kinase [Verrucomicrobiota bacterium]